MTATISRRRLGWGVAMAAGVALVASGTYATGAAGRILAATEINPCAAKTLNPCAAKTLNPCAAKTLNPCAAKTLNPCAAKTLNPCAAKTLNPCAAKTLNPCAARTLNPCRAKTLNPCDAKTLNPCDAKTGPAGGAAGGGAPDAARANPCNPCGMRNPCNPCGGARVDADRFVQPRGTELAAADLALGEQLWNDRALGNSGLACGNCHIDKYLQMNPTFKEPYPHYVAMPAQQGGVSQVSAAEMVQFCMLVPMMSDPLPWSSRELASLAAYVESIQAGYQPVAGTAPVNPCNPCGARNPCNPCAMKNPCGSR